MRHVLILVATIAGLLTSVRATQAQILVPVSQFAEISIDVHPDKVLTISTSDAIERVEIGVVGYKASVHPTYLTLRIPKGGANTNLLIWTKSRQQLTINMRIASWEAATSAVHFVRPIDDSAQISTIDAPPTSPIPPVPAARNAPGKLLPRQYALSIATLTGRWRTEEDNHREDAPFWAVGLCGERRISHLTLVACAMHLAPTRALFRPATCISTGPCEAQLQHAAHAAVLNTGASVRTGHSLFTIAQVNMGIMARYNRVTRLHEFRTDTLINAPTRVRAVYERDLRFSLFGSAGVGVGYRILPNIEIATRIEAMADIVKTSNFSAFGARIHVLAYVL